jgi:hypothetical protein
MFSRRSFVLKFRSELVNINSTFRRRRVPSAIAPLYANDCPLLSYCYRGQVFPCVQLLVFENGKALAKNERGVTRYSNRPYIILEGISEERRIVVKPCHTHVTHWQCILEAVPKHQSQDAGVQPQNCTRTIDIECNEMHEATYTPTSNLNHLILSLDHRSKT